VGVAEEEARAGPVPPTQVLRMAATCEESRCSHLDGSDRRLATRIVPLLPPVVAVLPSCAIRAEVPVVRPGRPGCLPTEAMEQAARPQPVR
jgi:hypothetical protein